MEWYYAAGSTRKGPVEARELERLASIGEVTPQTLVWRDGMATWQEFGVTFAGSLQPGMIACAACGKTVAENESFLLSDLRYCAACKPQILQRLQEGLPPVSAHAEETRNKYISHEASVKSVGLLYFIGSVIIFLGGLGCVVGGALDLGQPAHRSVADSPVLMILLGVLIAAVGVGQFITGRGLRKLRAWARVPTGIFSGIGLLGFPVGTIINAYILYLVFSQKGKMVFSEEYRAVIEQTPHIKYRTSIIVWIFVILLLVLMAIGIGAAILDK